MANKKSQSAFMEVLYNSEDQVTLRLLLDELVPEDVKAEVVRRFKEARAERKRFEREHKSK